MINVCDNLYVSQKFKKYLYILIFRSNTMYPKDNDPLNSLKENAYQNMSDKLFDKLANLILSGELPPGYIFPNENDLCKQLSIGRSTLREAYKALLSFGYITRSKRGTVVNDMRFIINAKPFNHTLENSNYHDLIEFRLMLESETAYYAALRSTKEDIEKIEGILTELNDKKKSDNLDLRANLDIDFHLAISEATKNKLFYDTMIQASAVWQKGVVHNLERVVNSKEFEKMLLQHRKIVNAIIDKNPKRAKELAIEHVVFVSKL